MILFHRITPFCIGLILVLGFLLSSLFPLAVFWFFGVGILLLAFFFARLLGFRFSEPDRRELFFSPMIFFVSAFMFFLLLEANVFRVVFFIVSTLLLFFYAEHLFRFLHLPKTYQNHGLQNTMSALAIFSLFFGASVCFGFSLFLRIGILGASVLWLVFCFTVLKNSFWSAQIPEDRARLYSLCGAVLLSELFGALLYLPLSFLSAGALMAVSGYVFLGVSRAFLLLKLTKPVVQRYLSVGIVGMFMIIIALFI